MTPFEQSRAAYKVLASYYNLPLSERIAIGNSMDKQLAEAQSVIDANRSVVRGTVKAAVKAAPDGSITTIKF